MRQWHRDKQSPDSWGAIPEFGVQPADVDFEGFGFPLVTNDEGWDRIVRDVVRMTRDLARERFATLAELHAEGEKTWQAIEAGEKRDLTDRENTALIFQSFDVCGLPLFTRKQALRVLLQKALLLASWAKEGPEAAAKRALSMRASGAGKASGERRQSDLSLRDERIVQAAMTLGWPGARGVASTLANRTWDPMVGEARIRQILARARRRRGSAKKELKAN